MPSEEKPRRQPDSRKSEVAYAALRKLAKASKILLVKYLSLKWLNKQITYSLHPAVVRKSTPRSIKQSLPEKLVPYLGIITFIYCSEKSVEKEKIRGEFLTATPGSGESPSVYKSRKDKSIFLSALKLARDTVQGAYVDAKKVQMEKQPSENQLNYAADTILNHVWNLKFKNPSKYFSELLRKWQNQEPARSRKKNIRESPRLMREKLTEFAEQALVTQVSNLPLIFIDYSFVFVSQSSVSVHFFRSKNKRQINLVSSRVER